MGMTIAEKILARAAGKGSVAPGEIVVVKVDTAVVIDIGFYPGIWRWPARVWDPDRIVVVHDHVVPAKDVQSAEALQAGRRFVARYGVTRFHDVGATQGISHQVAADEAYALPGTVLVCVDSHTCSGGALNCCARGIGPAELIYVLCTGETWFRVAPTVRYELEGRLRSWVTAKDAFLWIAARFGFAREPEPRIRRFSPDDPRARRATHAFDHGCGGERGIRRLGAGRRASRSRACAHRSALLPDEP